MLQMKQSGFVMIKIAVASGKGGTGKTLVATNIFYSLLKKGVNAVLVDCDAEAPDAVAFFKTVATGTADVTTLVPLIDTDICTFCGKCHEYCNYNAIFILPPMKIIQVIEELCHGCGACTVACKEAAITEKSVVLGSVNYFTADVADNIDEKNNIIEARMKPGVMSPVPVIKAAIRLATEDAEIAIFDSPPGTSCPFIQTVSASDYVILVTEPTPFGLSNLQQSIETLKEINKPCGVIINREGIGNTEVNNWLHINMIPVLMEIPFDKEIARVYSEGKLLSCEKKYSSLFDNLIARLIKLTNKIKPSIQ